jgi:hypothetical protein
MLHCLLLPFSDDYFPDNCSCPKYIVRPLRTTPDEVEVNKASTRAFANSHAFSMTQLPPHMTIIRVY